MKKETLLLGAGLIVLVWLGVMFVFFSEGQKKPADAALQVDTAKGSDSQVGANVGGTQDVYLRALSNGTYDKSEITVKKGVPVRLHFTADPNAGCGRAMMIYGMNVRAISKSGEEQIVTFTPEKEGSYQYNCTMGMWRPGRFVVTA